jgi:hypothetical protein
VKLPKDWRQHQVMIDGKERPIETLSIDELRFSLTKAIDAIEEAEGIIERAGEAIETWRDGKDVSPERLGCDELHCRTCGLQKSQAIGMEHRHRGCDLEKIEWVAIEDLSQVDLEKADSR